ncbi:DUF2442 domain-containing protein [Fibrella sp. HMF5335]|uniref:DUF2442 domain-containing protein n=1 Tax=Fibrella rubiginis TaxID=2817060 RepID=A0A939K5J3_9BACT|nr:DUF2442 domain-containing protein [Fibrella rubiginis]MBO0937301.1 DUF2442 domain-containing protein [Fibrella rubiginis]
MLPRVKSILAVEPYKVTCLWNTGEVREVDFQPYLAESKPQSSIARLADKQLFSEVKTDGRTLYWDDLLVMIDYDGSQHPAPLDFDPDVMYQRSRLVN